MQIKVKYFALLREALNRDEETVEVPADVKTAGELRAWLAANDSEHNEAFASARP